MKTVKCKKDNMWDTLLCLISLLPLLLSDLFLFCYYKPKTTVCLRLCFSFNSFAPQPADNMLFISFHLELHKGCNCAYINESFGVCCSIQALECDFQSAEDNVVHGSIFGEGIKLLNLDTDQPCFQMKENLLLHLWVSHR